MTVDAATGAVRDTLRDSTGLARVPWVEGPTIDISVRPDLKTLRTIPVGSSTIESRDGWIRLRGRTPEGRQAVRLIGPGAALAATAGGRFIVALAPDPDAQRYSAPVRLVVYQVNP